MQTNYLNECADRGEKYCEKAGQKNRLIKKIYEANAKMCLKVFCT